jgi:hypothetical protein
MDNLLIAIGLVAIIFWGLFSLGSTIVYWNGPTYASCQNNWPLGVKPKYAPITP